MWRHWQEAMFDSQNVVMVVFVLRLNFSWFQSGIAQASNECHEKKSRMLLLATIKRLQCRSGRKSTRCHSIRLKLPKLVKQQLRYLVHLSVEAKLSSSEASPRNNSSEWQHKARFRRQTMTISRSLRVGADLTHFDIRFVPAWT